MSFFDALFGRSKLKRPDLDPLFRLASAQVDLEGRGIRLEPVATLGYRPVETPAFDETASKAGTALDLYAREHGVLVARKTDQDGYAWVVVRGGNEADDRITALHVMADILTEEGFGGELLAAVFPGRDHHGDNFLLVYNYKRSAFYPFRELPGKQRDNAAEIRIQALLEGVLPVEKDLERWYALWDLPL